MTKVENGVSTVIGSNLAVAPPNVGPHTDRLVYGLGHVQGLRPERSGQPRGRVSTTTPSPPPSSTRSATAAPKDAPGPARATTPSTSTRRASSTCSTSPACPAAARTPGEDVFAGFNLNVIALEIPTTQGHRHRPAAGPQRHAGRRHACSASGRRPAASATGVCEPNGDVTECGPWVQVGREGLPLVNAGLIGVIDQSKYLRTTPRTDVENFATYFLNPVLVRDVEALGIYRALGVPDETVATLKTQPRRHPADHQPRQDPVRADQRRRSDLPGRSPRADRARQDRRRAAPRHRHRLGVPQRPLASPAARRRTRSRSTSATC